MTHRLLLVEDEDRLRHQLIEVLERHDYSVDVAVDGDEGLYVGRKFDFDIGVIDIGLPKLSGIEIIETLRSEGKDFPILILTARGDWKDKVDGLSAGADDYLVKPFHLQEFLARLEALIRRATGEFTSVLEHGPIRLDTKSRDVKVHDRRIEVTAYEYNLLEYLMKRPEQVVSKTELTEHLYDQDFDRDSNVIEVFIGRLRRKLDPDNTIRPIETVRGHGYRFVPPSRA